MKVKWDWGKVQFYEYKVRGYFTLEQYRWLKKVVRRIHRYACDNNVNIPTPYVGYSDLCFDEHEGSKCAHLIFERGNVTYDVIIDVLQKDKIRDYGYEFSGTIGYLGDTLLTWPEERSPILDILYGWQNTVREKRIFGWFGPFWMAYYGITEELPWQLRIHWERFKQRFSKKAPMGLQLTLCSAYLHWCVLLRNIVQGRFRIALRSLCGMFRKW